MAKNKFDMKAMLWMVLLTSLLAGALSAVQGLLLSALASVGAGFVNVLQALFGAVWVTVGTVIRKGKEMFGETMVALAWVALVFVLLARLPFQIPLLSYAVEWSLEGFILAVGTIWMSQAFARMIMKML